MVFTVQCIQSLVCRLSMSCDLRGCEDECASRSVARNIDSLIR